ncbi:hypothetical protein CLOM_g16333 [Closterium sp. NIES-68]|nr:hypothetical protein CLOM_g16333 [Closterium sp. NIES-68]
MEDCMEVARTGGRPMGDGPTEISASGMSARMLADGADRANGGLLEGVSGWSEHRALKGISHATCRIHSLFALPFLLPAPYSPSQPPLSSAFSPTGRCFY